MPFPHGQHISNINLKPERLAPSRIAVEPQRRSSEYDPRLQSDQVGRGRGRSVGRGGGRGPGRASGRGPPQGQRNIDSRHIKPSNNAEKRTEGAPDPKYDMLVVVEGINDMKAVRRAMNADVSFLVQKCRNSHFHTFYSQVYQISML